MPETGPPRPAEGRGPIFIIGAMGSGTTLLRLVLDSHDRIAIPRETGFMRAERAHRFIPFKWSGKDWYKRLGWSDEELDELLRDFYTTLFRRYAEQHGKVRWGDKTPLHTWHVDDMARMFPDAVFVALMRHPGGSVASNMTRWNYGLSRAAYHYYRYTTEIARQASRYPGRFAILRYEDLVLQPEATLRQLLEWLGEPWSDHVLDHHNVQASRGGNRKVEGRVLVDDPIDVSRISKWTETIDERGRRKLRRRIGGVEEFFGYDIDDPMPGRLREDGGLLLSGADVEERIPRFPRLDLRTQPRVPLVDSLYDPRRMHIEAGDLRGLDAARNERAERRHRRARGHSPPRRLALAVLRQLPPAHRRRLVSIARRFSGDRAEPAAPPPPGGAGKSQVTGGAGQNGRGEGTAAQEPRVPAGRG